MPPKAKFTREEVVRTALEMVRENGMDTLSARNLSARLGSSASPIFTIFQNMEDVQQEVISAAHEIYRNYLREDISALPGRRGNSSSCCSCGTAPPRR